MAERDEHQPDMIDIAKEQAKFFVRGKKDELQTELDELNNLRGGNVQARKGKMIRIDREVHHLEMRIKDWDHADKLFSEILDGLRNPGHLKPEQ